MFLFNYTWRRVYTYSTYVQGGGGYEIQLVEVSQICITQSIATKNKTLGWVNFVSYKPSKQEDG